jgi:hypothetical protein
MGNHNTKNTHLLKNPALDQIDQIAWVVGEKSLYI